MIDTWQEKEIQKLIEKQIKKEKSKDKPTFSERMADRVADFGGSWKFIFYFNIFFFGWIIINLYVTQFDPPPFIGLNLILSCLAVFQAPFILMSQNRISDIDRKRDEKEYKLSLKSEYEINEIDEKLNLIIEKLKDK